MKTFKITSLKTMYHTIQNFGRKFWRNSSHQKLADNILVNVRRNFQTTYNNGYVCVNFYKSIRIIEYTLVEHG